MTDFALGETQQAVASLAADVLGAADPWKELAQAGLLDVSQLSVLDTTVLLTEMGRHASPDSVKALATPMTGALPVARWGSADLQQELLPAIAWGELTLTATLREPSNPAPAIPATTLTNGKITGTKIGAPTPTNPPASLTPASLTPASLTPASSMIMSSSEQIVAQTAHDHAVALVDPGALG